MRVLEVAAVALLAIATVGSAWCAYQAAQWNGEESSLARQSSLHRVEASRLFSLAAQTVAYDMNTIGQYAEAVATDEDKLATFVRDSLVRDEFLPVLDRWEADVLAGRHPTPLTEDADYMEQRLGGYHTEDAAAEEASRASDEAGRTAESYVLGALLVAVSLFFAGVTGSFRMRTVRIALLFASGLTLAFAASRVADLGVL